MLIPHLHGGHQVRLLQVARLALSKCDRPRLGCLRTSNMLRISHHDRGQVLLQRLLEQPGFPCWTNTQVTPTKDSTCASYTSKNLS